MGKQKLFPPLAMVNNLKNTAEEMKQMCRNWKAQGAILRGEGRAGYTDNDIFDELRKTEFLHGYAVAKWAENKQVYSFDKNFIDILVTSPIDMVLHEELFDRLPYKAFVVKIEDTYAFVCYDKGELYPGQTYIGLHPMLRKNTTVGGVTLILNRGWDYMPMNKFLDLTADDFADETERENFVMTESSAHEMIFVLSQICMYLAAGNAVIRENEEQKKIYRPRLAGAPPKNRYSEVRLWDCGIRYTKDRVKAIRKDIEEFDDDGKPMKKRKSPRPHWRRAHWQHFWCGKGRTELKLNWIEPSFVGGQSVDTPVVIHEPA